MRRVNRRVGHIELFLVASCAGGGPGAVLGCGSVSQTTVAQDPEAVVIRQAESRALVLIDRAE
jgi:hypothetical protein